MGLEFDMDLLWHALEREKQDAAWDLWRSFYKDMTEDTFISFGDFMGKLYGRSKPMKSKEEIESEFSGIVQQDKEK